MRHGESECSVQRRLYGRTDCALTGQGLPSGRAKSGEKLAAWST
ncbi:MAG: histidine phosphatase family protein [Lachnospiraceae bacterium]